MESPELTTPVECTVSSCFSMLRSAAICCSYQRMVS